MFFLLKNTVKIALQYLFNDFKLFNSFFNLKLNFKLRVDPKMHTFKSCKFLENLEKNCKNEWESFIYF